MSSIKSLRSMGTEQWLNDEDNRYSKLGGYSKYKELEKSGGIRAIADHFRIDSRTVNNWKFFDKQKVDQ